MAFRATLSFAGKEFDVLDCTYSLKRDVDSKGSWIRRKHSTRGW